MNGDDELLLTLTLNEGCAKLLMKSVDFHLEKWAGGDPSEQAGLINLQTGLRSICLEYQFMKDFPDQPST